MQLALRAFALWILSISAAVAADPLAIEPQDGVLVLRNGFIMSGRITSLGETFLVSFGDSGEAQLPRSEVEFQCRTLDEAYCTKRDTLESDDIKHHLQLADWCLRHGILARAADQLLVARIIDPKHPALDTLERRLQSLATMSAAAAAAKAMPPGRATQASHTAPADPAPATHDIEPFLVQQFTIKVQPILLNRCATHACHGATGTSAYRLLRPSLGQVASSRMTNRNLQATLAYINRDQPESSRLLVMAQQPHGSVESAVFEDKSAGQLDQITAWVRRLGMRFPNASMAQRRPQSRTASYASAKNQPIGQAAQDAAGTKPTAVKPEEPIADPVDPSEFNRRFHGRP